MRTSHVRVYSAKKSEEPRVQDSASSCTDNGNYNDDKYDQHEQPRKSTRQKFSYQSFQEESKRIICVTKKEVVV